MLGFGLVVTIAKRPHYTMLYVAAFTNTKEPALVESVLTGEVTDEEVVGVLLGDDSGLVGSKLCWWGCVR